MRPDSPWLSAALILLGLSGAAPGSASAKPPAGARAEDELRIHFLDVGQGDGALLVSPAGKSVLVDAGPTEADRVVLDALRREGVGRLDLVLLTHPHLDHFGGLRSVLREVPAGLLLDPGFDHPGETYRRLLAWLEETKTPYKVARAGRKIDLGGGATLTVLAPRDPLFSGTRSDANANSVVARLDYGTVSVLFTGDAEEETEARLLADGASLGVTVLKVAHHGSAHSTSSRFLAATKPKAAVASAGRDNDYGHPHPDTLGRLERAGVEIYRTDVDGTVTLVTNGRTWRLVRGGEFPARADAASESPRGLPGGVAGAPGDGGAVFASRSSRVYHEPWCRSGLRRIAPANLVTYASKTAAEADGKRKAEDCGAAPKEGTAETDREHPRVGEREIGARGTGGGGAPGSAGGGQVHPGGPAP